MAFAKKAILNLGKVGIVGIALALVFWLALTFAYCIPQSAMEKHVKQATDVLQSEGLYPESYADGRIDNFTVAIMINEAYQGSASSGGAFKAALLSPQYYNADKNRVETLDGIFDNEPNASYERYWHGYLVFLKPLLVFFGLKTIRTLLQVIMLGALVSCCCVLLKRLDCRNGIVSVVAIVGAYGLYNCFDVVAVLPLASSFIISMLATIWVLLLKEMKPTSLFMGFFLIGGLTVYFDFLDNPLLTLCIPLSMMVVRWFNDSNVMNPSFMESVNFCSAREIFLMLIVACLGWVIGYGYLWALKWLLASVVLDKDIIANAMNAVQTRTGMDPVTKNVGLAFYFENMKEALVKNISFADFRIRFTVTFMILFFIVLLGKELLRLCQARYAGIAYPKQEAKKRFTYYLFLLVISLLPYLWYMVLANHSVVHAEIIAYRNQLITLECSLLLLGSSWVSFYQATKVLKDCKGK